MPRKRKEKCPQCGKSFKLLKSHVTRSHPVRVFNQELRMSPVDSEYERGRRYGMEIGIKETQEKFRSEIFNRKLVVMEYFAQAVDAASHALKYITEVK